MSDIGEGLTFPMDDYEGIGGGVKDVYQVRALSNINANESYAHDMPIILVSKPPQKGAEELTDLSGFYSKTGLKPEDIVAFNGVATLKQMMPGVASADFQKQLYILGQSYDKMSQLVPEQAQFICFVQHLYFLARIQEYRNENGMMVGVLGSNQPKVPTWSEDFGPKYIYIKQNLKNEYVDAFGVMLQQINKLSAVLQETIPVKYQNYLSSAFQRTTDILKSIKFRSPSEIYQDFVNFKRLDEKGSPGNADTEEDFMKLSVESRQSLSGTTFILPSVLFPESLAKKLREQFEKSGRGNIPPTPPKTAQDYKKFTEEEREKIKNELNMIFKNIKIVKERLNNQLQARDLLRNTWIETVEKFIQLVNKVNLAIKTNESPDKIRELNKERTDITNKSFDIATTLVRENEKKIVRTFMNLQAFIQAYLDLKKEAEKGGTFNELNEIEQFLYKLKYPTEILYRPITHLPNTPYDYVLEQVKQLIIEAKQQGKSKMDTMVEAINYARKFGEDKELLKETIDNMGAEIGLYVFNEFNSEPQQGGQQEESMLKEEKELNDKVRHLKNLEEEYETGYNDLKINGTKLLLNYPKEQKYIDSVDEDEKVVSLFNNNMVKLTIKLKEISNKSNDNELIQTLEKDLKKTTDGFNKNMKIFEENRHKEQLENQSIKNLYTKVTNEENHLLPLVTKIDKYNSEITELGKRIQELKQQQAPKITADPFAPTLRSAIRPNKSTIVRNAVQKTRKRKGLDGTNINAAVGFVNEAINSKGTRITIKNNVKRNGKFKPTKSDQKYLIGRQGYRTTNGTISSKNLEKHAERLEKMKNRILVTNTDPENPQNNAATRAQKKALQMQEALNNNNVSNMNEENSKKWLSSALAQKLRKDAIDPKGKKYVKETFGEASKDADIVEFIDYLIENNKVDVISQLNYQKIKTSINNLLEAYDNIDDYLEMLELRKIYQDRYETKRKDRIKLVEAKKNVTQIDAELKKYTDWFAEKETQEKEFLKEDKELLDNYEKAKKDHAELLQQADIKKIYDDIKDQMGKQEFFIKKLKENKHTKPYSYT